MFGLGKLHRQHINVQLLQNTVNESATALTIPYTPTARLLQYRITQLESNVVNAICRFHQPRVKPMVHYHPHAYST